jgi:prepilin-type N-terminal cleavage/methylation domain-containing protein
VVTRRRQRGYTLMEVSVVLAIFGIFLFIVVTLTAEMKRQEKKYPVNFLGHPEVNAVLARIRRDVADTTAYYPEYAGVAASPAVLWVDTITEAGTSEVVMYDFRTPGEVHRRVYNSAQGLVSEWVAHNVPVFTCLQLDPDMPPYLPHGSNGIELMAVDVSTKPPRLAIDEIIIPRPHP